MGAAPRRKLIVVSNRGPVSFARVDGERVERRGAGGLVTALRGLLAHHDVTWIASAMSDEDARVAAEPPREDLGYRLRFVVHDSHAFDRFYNVAANPVLWFLQHRLWELVEGTPSLAEFDDAWRSGYVPVNAAFADAVAEELERTPDAAVLAHDYHLYLLPKLVRERAPGALVSHFTHIPWPEPDAWEALPGSAAREIHEGLVAADVVGLHTRRWRDNFLACAERFAGGTGSARVTAHPISVDVGEFEELANSDRVLAAQRELEASRPEQLVVRVDRTEPSKNIVRGFEAFGRYLERHPGAHGRVGMLALLDPSRQVIPQYAAYRSELEAAASRVNAQFGTAAWQPVVLDVADDFPRSVAAYKLYDVLLVNAWYDGLNLVAKEAPLVNERDGAVVLSRNAGAFEELGDWVVACDPADVDDQADALARALDLAPAERRARAAAIRAQVRAHDIGAWLDAQLADLDAVAATAQG